MKPPSDFSVRTGREHVGHVPFDPPLTSKQGRHRYLESLGAVGSGYIVASGAKGDEQIAQECVFNVSLR